MLPDFVVAHGKLRPESDRALVVVKWFVVQRAEDQLLIVVAVIDADPHPLPDPGGIIRELDLYKIAPLVSSQAAPRQTNSTPPCTKHEATVPASWKDEKSGYAICLARNTIASGSPNVNNRKALHNRSVVLCKQAVLRTKALLLKIRR